MSFSKETHAPKIIKTCYHLDKKERSVIFPKPRKLEKKLLEFWKKRFCRSLKNGIITKLAIITENQFFFQVYF